MSAMAIIAAVRPRGHHRRRPRRGDGVLRHGCGLEVEGRTFVEGDFLDTVSGIPDSRTEIVMLRPPGGGTGLELAPLRATRPRARVTGRDGHHPGSPQRVLRDHRPAGDWSPGLSEDGYGLVGGIGEFEGAWRMAYVRGPEGLVVALAERLG